MLQHLTAVTRIMRYGSFALLLSVLFLMGTALTARAAVWVLLVPDISGDRVLAFDPFDGHLVNQNFIPDDGRLGAPKKAISSGRGTTAVPLTR